MAFITLSGSRNLLLIIAILGVFVLVSCAEPEIENTTPLGTATQKIVQITPVDDLGQSTAFPTRTPKREPSIKHTLTPTLTTPQALSATAFNTFDQCRSYFDEQRLSPSKQWYLCERGDPQGADLLIINSDGGRWRFSYNAAFGAEYWGDIRYFKWTQDETFLYFAVMNPVDGPGPFTANAEALFRMDLSSGNVVKILGGIDSDDPNRDFYVVSISPTDRRLVYSDGYLWQGNKPQTKLYITDLQVGTQTIIPVGVEFSQIGGFIWSEDGLQLVYKLYSTSDDYCLYSYSIRLLDLKNMSSITFIKDMPVNQCGDGQAIYDILSVTSEAVTLEYQEQIWTYDIETKKLHLQGAGNPSP